MSRRAVRIGVASFFLVNAVAVMWPGYLPFNRVEPYVLGLPLSLVWPAVWVVLGGLALLLLDRTEEAASGASRSEGSARPPRTPGRESSPRPERPSERSGRDASDRSGPA